MNVAIVGSRNFIDLESVRKMVRDLAHIYSDNLVIVSGGAKGVDTAAEQEAVSLGVKILIFIPDWNKHGKSAGMIRNYDIVSASDRVIAFWNGSSKGTKRTIDIATKQGKSVTIIQESKLGTVHDDY